MIKICNASNISKIPNTSLEYRYINLYMNSDFNNRMYLCNEKKAFIDCLCSMFTDTCRQTDCQMHINGSIRIFHAHALVCMTAVNRCTSLAPQKVTSSHRFCCINCCHNKLMTYFAVVMCIFSTDMLKTWKCFFSKWHISVWIVSQGSITKKAV